MLDKTNDHGTIRRPYRPHRKKSFLLLFFKKEALAFYFGNARPPLQNNEGSSPFLKKRTKKLLFAGSSLTRRIRTLDKTNDHGTIRRPYRPHRN
jgi:hypothetical protein